MSTMVYLLSFDASYTDPYLVHPGLPPAEEPVQSARATSFARWLMINLAILIARTTPPRTSTRGTRTQAQRPCSLLERTGMTTPMMSRTLAFFLAMQVRPHSLVGAISPRSASLPSATTLSGIKPLRTGPARTSLISCVYSCASFLFIFAQPELGIALILWPFVVLAILRFPYDLNLRGVSWVHLGVLDGCQVLSSIVEAAGTYRGSIV